MVELLTAAEARKLAGPTVDEMIERLLITIKRLAKEKKRQCNTGVNHKDDLELWVNSGYGPTEEWKEAKKKLEGLGYNVSFYYSDGCQFVNMYTIIKW